MSRRGSRPPLGEPVAQFGRTGGERGQSVAQLRRAVVRRGGAGGDRAGAGGELVRTRGEGCGAGSELIDLADRGLHLRVPLLQTRAQRIEPGEHLVDLFGVRPCCASAFAMSERTCGKAFAACCTADPARSATSASCRLPALTCWAPLARLCAPVASCAVPSASFAVPSARVMLPVAAVPAPSASLVAPSDAVMSLSRTSLRPVSRRSAAWLPTISATELRIFSTACVPIDDAR